MHQTASKFGKCVTKKWFNVQNCISYHFMLRFLEKTLDSTFAPTGSVHNYTRTHTHPFNGPFSGTTQVSRYRKGNTIWIFVKQETLSGSGISWAECKSAPRCRQITTPAPHYSLFLQAGCPSYRRTSSVKALKVTSSEGNLGYKISANMI